MSFIEFTNIANPKVEAPLNNRNNSQNNRDISYKVLDKDLTNDSFQYNDPLMNWPVRGFAYSNELGVAISEISPKLGTALWVPALMYFGADIYDKYKNDETSFDPNAKRGFSQAVFQALASVVLPTVAVHSGQEIFGRSKVKGFSLQAKEEALRCVVHFVEHTSLTKYKDDIATFKRDFHTDLRHYIDEQVAEYNVKGICKKIRRTIFSNKHQYLLGGVNINLIEQFTDKSIDDIFAIRKQLIDIKKPEKLSDKLFRKFFDVQPEYKKKFGDFYLSRAAKHISVENIKSEIFKLKLWKTLGGFVALGLMIKPIDMFVEHCIMEKYIKPNLTSKKQMD